MIWIQNKLRPTTASFRIVYIIFTQWRTNTLWATKRKKKTSTDIALDYFDTVYGPLYENQWPSIRLALLSPHKYCAVVNNYGDVDSLSTQLQNEGAINIREMFDVHKKNLSEKKLKVKRKPELKHIYNLDTELKKIASVQRDKDFKVLYPDKDQGPSAEGFFNNNSDGQEQNLSKEELIKQAKASLDQSLAEASIDVSRQIDPIEGLSSSKINDFVPVSKLKGMEGFVSEAEHFSFYNEPRDFPVTVKPEESLNFPPHLQIYTFIPGSISIFSPPKTGLTGVTGYYLMDAASILPVLALGLEPGDTVLDMCAAPGGKSLLCLQTLYPDSLMCNDVSLSRLNRLRYVMQQYFYDWEKKVTISNEDGTLIEEMEAFSKILVDVPCTTDRLSVIENDNNIFKPSRNKERILLPQLQVELLFHALKLLKKGGSLVYSTCSLNPAQNDGVVQMALRKVWEETSMKIVVKDLSRALEPTTTVFQFADSRYLKYGSLVVPYLPSNFGPMYFCKLDKIN